VTLYNRYILVLTLILAITSIIFAATAVSDLGLCFAIYLIECLILTELFIHISPRAKRNLSRVNYFLFTLFVLVLVYKVAEILLPLRG